MLTIILGHAKNAFFSVLHFLSEKHVPLKDFLFSTFKKKYIYNANFNNLLNA